MKALVLLLLAARPPVVCLTLWPADQHMGMVLCPQLALTMKATTFCARKDGEERLYRGSFLSEKPCDEACRAEMFKEIAHGFREVPCGFPQS